jgi:fluoroquinolone resistance protein
MSPETTGQEAFSHIDFSVSGMPGSEFENCTFANCQFLHVDLSRVVFLRCVFSGCDLSMAKLPLTVIRDVKFVGCKLLGTHFEHCSKRLFSAEFQDCILRLSSFSKLVLRRTRFQHCALHEADFTDCDLSGSIFDDCDLTRARFLRTNLEKADFRTSFGYSIDPETNRLKKAKFSMAGILGLLDKYDILVE